MTITYNAFEDAVGNVDASSFKNQDDRRQAYRLAQKLVARLETPQERILNAGVAVPFELMALKICTDLDLFNKWKERGAGVMTTEQIAEMTGADPNLLVRLLRHLVIMFYVEAPSDNSFKPTSLSLALAHKNYTSAMNYMFETNMPLVTNFPKFAVDTKYQNPMDPQHGNFQHLYSSGDPTYASYFAWLSTQPQSSKDFGQFMELVNDLVGPWVVAYPPEQLVADAKPDRAVLVDIGGSTGHDIERFRAIYPDLPEGALILQDQPEVISQAKTRLPVQTMAHDFFTPQPVKGARAYFLRHVLHDWSDDQARQILEQIVPAMDPAYSRVLICEEIVSSQCRPIVTASDLTMMVALAATERSKADWEALLKSAGLKIVKIWTSPSADADVIEAALA